MPSDADKRRRQCQRGSTHQPLRHAVGRRADRSRGCAGPRRASAVSLAVERRPQLLEARPPVALVAGAAGRRARRWRRPPWRPPRAAWPPSTTRGARCACRTALAGASRSAAGSLGGQERPRLAPAGHRGVGHRARRTLERGERLAPRVSSRLARLVERRTTARGRDALGVGVARAGRARARRRCCGLRRLAGAGEQLDGESVPTSSRRPHPRRVHLVEVERG